jgi:hypothetical protein
MHGVYSRVAQAHQRRLFEMIAHHDRDVLCDPGSLQSGGSRSSNDQRVMFTDAAADRGISRLNPLPFVTAFCLVPFLLEFVDIAQSSGDSVGAALFQRPPVPIGTAT